ncbi:hypothetical protein F5X96DRAFT_668178 [Biscogniauxia mediterranea]|nr:hypothetical protein F5X96DRAFT_668178 [Biscogniauxia mediterranea]
MADVYISPDSYKEAASPRILCNTGLELAQHQPPPPNWGYDPVAQTSTPVEQEHRICGLHRSAFILAVILLVVIIAAAVGGGVGGSLAVQNAKTNAASNLTTADAPTLVSTVTVTRTATAAATGTRTGTSTTVSGLTVPTGLLALDCPGLDSEGDQVIAWDRSSWTFTPTCGTDFQGADFGAVVVYSFHDCLQACAAHNHFSGESQCAAVTFSANQTAQIPRNFGNCWLKTGTGTQVSGRGNTFVSAVLRSSI